MKKTNKKTNNNPSDNNESLLQWRKNFIFSKRTALREQKKNELELERAEIFEKKRQAASSKKAPLTLRTKSFYRFSKDFPSNVNDTGFRENDILSPKRRKKRAILTLISCVLVFCLTFIFANVGIELSSKTPEETTQDTDISQNSDLYIYHFSNEALANADIEQMLDILKENNSSSALFEYKTEYGYVLFPTSAVIGSNTYKKIGSAEKTVEELKRNGIKTAAYISCFKDTVVSVADLTYSVRQTSSVGNTWKDNSDNGWLNPFSTVATSYLQKLVQEAAETGFDYILLDNVCFSTDAGNAKAYYTDENTSSYNRNTILKLFINSCMRKASSSKIIVMGDITAFNSKSTSEGKYAGSLLSLGSESLALDLRLSKQSKTVKIGSNEFSLINELPYVFVLEAAEYAAGELADSENSVSDTFIVLENTESISDQIAAAKYAGFKKIIIW